MLYKLLAVVALVSAKPIDGIVTPAIKADDSGAAAKTGYTVPNFGMDSDIKDSLAHTADLEKVHGKWTPTKKEKGDGPYTVPNFGMDVDMIDAKQSIASTQSALGINWEPMQDKNGVWQVPQPIDNRSYSYSG
tara:strand:+ start:94 stop:492 length:399 start_codon:yes stop_codon:yes gene_type:complete